MRVVDHGGSCYIPTEAQNAEQVDQAAVFVSEDADAALGCSDSEGQEQGGVAAEVYLGYNLLKIVMFTRSIHEK